VRLNDDGQIELSAPWGINDLVNIVIRPTPLYVDIHSERRKNHELRVSKKWWNEIWPHVKTD